MATKLFLRNTTTNGVTDTGDGIVYDLSTVAGASADTGAVALTNGGTNIQWTKTAGGLSMAWISSPIETGFTLTAADISAWLEQGNANDEAGGRLRIYKYTPGVPTITELAGGPFDDGVEMDSMNPTEMTWAANPTDTAFAVGDRILIRLFATNITTMTVGTATLTFNAADAATGDSFFNIAETISFSSPSASPSSSVSSSPSSSISLSPSSSPSPSSSVSLSISLSPSSSVSSSVSLSPSVSVSSSISLSPSASPSPSSSESPSPSSSLSSSVSISLSSSVSLSISPSPSASPSVGYEDYTRFHYAALPADNADLTTQYSAQDYIDVNTDDGVRVAQSASGGEYAIHQFKDFVGAAISATLEWQGQTNQACFLSPVLLQIYNHNTTTWDTIDTDNTTTINVDFTLGATVSDLTDYKDGNNVISCRVYQKD